MNIKKIKTDDYKIFTAFALFWVFLAWLGFFLALYGFFYSWIFIGYFILGIANAVYIFRKKILNRSPSEFYGAALIFLVITILFSLFTVPTIFSGRDQGSISEAGIRLAQNHQLEFSTPASQEFFKIYGPGKALNFPGFHYLPSGGLITQFPIPYIAWLGIFYSIFGLAGLIIANAILFYLFLFSSYLLFRLFAPIKYSVIFLLLILASFSFSWFLKFTLSENMALAFIWLGILQLVLFFKELGSSVVIPEFSVAIAEKNVRNLDSRLRGNGTFYFFSLLTIFGLVAFTRVEGMAILAMLIVIILFNKETRNFLMVKKMKRIFFPFFLFTAVFILNFIINFNFFKEIGKAFLKNSTQAIEAGSLLNTANIFLIYGIAPYLILGIIGIIYFLKRKSRLELLPFILVLPLFFYLASPHISSDHPWMLRRYVFAILPVFIFYTTLWLVYYFKEKKKFLPCILIIIFLLLNFLASFKYFTFSENKNLLEQTKNLSQNFSNDDLILIDRLVSGDGWSMLSGPMNFIYNKNAVYFFNPDDLSEINLEKFDKIYFIVPDEKISFYENSALKNRLSFYKDYQLKTSGLELSEKSAKNISWPEKKNIKVEGKIFEIKK